VFWEQIDGKNDPKRQQPIDKERTVYKVYKYKNCLEKVLGTFINFIYLLILFLVTILSQSLFTLMRSHFMALSFFTRRHTSEFFLN